MENLNKSTNRLYHDSPAFREWESTVPRVLNIKQVERIRRKLGATRLFQELQWQLRMELHYNGELKVFQLGQHRTK